MDAFICAMPMELQAVSKRLNLRKSTLAGMPVRSGTLGDREVVAIFTGMGTALATKATERLLEAVHPDRVIVVGITGGMENETPIGTLVLPEVVVNSNTGSEHRPTPLGGGTHHGTMWTTDVMTAPEELADLRAKGVVALDMETAAIAASCERRGIPWSVFRCISDNPADEIDDELFKMFNLDGSPNPGNIVRYLVKHPGRIPRLLKMGKNAKLAADNAADAAARACSA
jgi:adenosylhomocysteine nucleosidase